MKVLVGIGCSHTAGTAFLKGLSKSKDGSWLELTKGWASKPLAKKYKDPAGQFPVATKSTKDTFFVGVWPGMTDEQMDYIQEVLRKFCWKYKISIPYDERK